jgi:hypothetical protein
MSHQNYKSLEGISIKSTWSEHVTLDITRFLTLPLSFREPLKFLSILYQTYSYFSFYWNMNTVVYNLF